MQKWEYCAIASLHAPVGLPGITPYYPKLSRFTQSGLQVTDLGRKGGKGEQDYVAQLIAQMGEDGWEMVGIFQTGEKEHGIYFKRPKP